MNTEQYAPNSDVPTSGMYHCVMCKLSFDLAKTKNADPFLIATMYAKDAGIDTKIVQEIFAGCKEPIIRKKFKALDKFDECPIHKTATGWAPEQDIAQTWLEYYIEGLKGRADKEKEWVVMKLYDLSLKEPAQAWEIVQQINSNNISDENTCKLIDKIIGGSPLANILYACDGPLWKTILVAAANSTRLQYQLREIVEGSVNNPKRWQELQRFLAQNKKSS
jgi:hypothetical protein